MNPWAIVGGLVLAISLAGGGYYTGWEQRGDREAAKALVVERDAARVLAAETKRADGIAGQLALEKENIKTVTIEVIKQVPMVTTIYTEKVGDEPLPIPPAVYTVGFVRLWDAAYGPNILRAGTGLAPGAPRAPDILRAKISSADVLDNHIENAGKHAACYAQLNKLIDLELGRGGATPQPAPPSPTSP